MASLDSISLEDWNLVLSRQLVQQEIDLWAKVVVEGKTTNDQ